jgi:hypothetical protein
MLGSIPVVATFNSLFPFILFYLPALSFVNVISFEKVVTEDKNQVKREQRIKDSSDGNGIQHRNKRGLMN